MNVPELVQIFNDEKNNRELIKHALMFSGNLNDASDLVSALLIQVYMNEDMQKAEEPMAYFKTCLKNIALNQKARDKKCVVMSPSDIASLMGDIPAKPYDGCEEEQMREELALIFNQCSAGLIDAFMKYHLDGGYSVKELADSLGVKENTLSQQFHRMRKKVKDNLHRINGM